MINLTNNMNNRSRNIIIFWFISSLLIFFTAFIIIDRTQHKISENYKNLSLVMTQSIANESADILVTLPNDKKIKKIQDFAQTIVKNNNEIDFIKYRDAKSQIYFSTGEQKQPATKNSFLINLPLYLDNKIIGSIDVGFSGKTITDTTNATKNAIIIIFGMMWLLSLIAVLINTMLVARQISILSYGVRKISSGEFGYKLQQKDLWGEIKLLFNEFNKMSTKLREYEEKNIDELTYEKNKLESVLMSIANGVIVCDNTDKIILANNAITSMLRKNLSDMVGTDINKYADSSNATIFAEHIEQFKNAPLEQVTKEPLDFQINIENKVLKALMSPIFTSGQEYLGYIVVLHDITKEAEIDKLKTQFISNVSHELRTPVTVLRSYIDTLCNYGNDFDEETQKEFLQTMDQEATRLNNMVNDILDFSRLDSGNITLDKGFMDIKPIIENTVHSMLMIAQGKNITFNISVEPNLPQAYINLDSIERVLKNLLSNAIKYSNNDDKIIISAKSDTDKKNLIIEVEDFGVGIPKECLSKIFDRFYRVENKAHTVKGTGLGLHLVKVSIEKYHGGTVFAESELDKGSKFGFTLPILNQNEIKNEEILTQ